MSWLYRKDEREQVREKAKQDFGMWFESANEFFDFFWADFEKGKYKVSAFLLHQVTERYYSAFLLVFTGYRPKTHDLKKLGGDVGTDK